MLIRDLDGKWGIVMTMDGRLLCVMCWNTIWDGRREE